MGTAWFTQNASVVAAFPPRNSDVMFAGCEAGEIYRSQDRGETWRLTQTTLTSQSLRFSLGLVRSE